MNNTLRSSLKENLSEELALPLIDIPDRAIDSLLALIESKMPEKGSFNFGGTSTQVNYLTQEDAVQHGFNQAIDSVKSLLRGSDENNNRQ